MPTVPDTLSRTREPGSVPFDDPRHPRLAAMIRTMLGGHVECRDCGCQRRHELEIELTGGRQPVE
jgi:hypothetical protein